MKKLGDWVDETARTAVDVGTKVADQGRVMENARAQMPQPVQFDWNKAAAALSQPGTPAFVLASADIAVANAASRAAHDQAVTVMTDMENNSRQIDSTTPAFKPPFNPNTGKVEEPVMAVPRSGAAAFTGGADGLMSTQAASAGAATAAPPVTGQQSGSGAGAGAGGGAGAGSGVNQPAAAAYNPSAPGYTGAGAGGGGAGGGSSYTPQMGNTNTNTAAAYTPTAPNYSPSNTGSTYTSGSGGGGSPAPDTPTAPGYTPQMGTGGRTNTGQNQNVPKTPVVGKDLANPNYTPQNPKGPAAYNPSAPGYTGPGGAGGGAGGGGGGGGAGGGGGMKGGPMPYSPQMGAGGGGGFGGGASGAAGAGGSMQSGGASGVQGQAARGGMPMGIGSGGASAAGAGMGGAPMGGAPGGGKGEDDKEHRSASYIMGGDLFELPGENLPPSVIGAAKVKKQKGTESQ